MLTAKDGWWETDSLFEWLGYWETVAETNSKWIPIELITVLEWVRRDLEEIQSEIQFSWNNHEKLIAAITKKFGKILMLPSNVSNIIYRMNDWKTKDLISKMIARYAEKAEIIEMIWSEQERAEFFINPNWFWFEFDKLIAILKDS